MALLPGSRPSEVARILPIELDAARIIADAHPAQFWLIRAPSVKHEQLSNIYEEWMAENHRDLPLEIPEGDIHQLLPQAACAIVKSGTSTLEATVLHVPFAMVYRLSWPSWLFARPLVNTDMYCLANWIAGERIVPEFVQREATGQKIAGYVLSLLKDETKRVQVKENLAAAARRLGEQNAYERAARHIRDFLRKRDF